MKSLVKHNMLTCKSGDEFLLSELTGCTLLRHDHFEFRPKHSTALQQTRFIEGVVQELWHVEANRCCFPVMWLRPSILYRSTVSSTSHQSLIAPRTLQKSFLPTWKIGLSKCPSNQSYLLVTWSGMEQGVISHILFSLCQRHAFAIPRHRVGILR